MEYIFPVCASPPFFKDPVLFVSWCSLVKYLPVRNYGYSDYQTWIFILA